MGAARGVAGGRRLARRRPRQRHRHRRKDHEQIFERFQQAGNTLTDKPTGTGLGLPICREILRHFGGDIWVESEIGKGATFSFRIPAAGTRDAIAAPPKWIRARGGRVTSKQ